MAASGMFGVDELPDGDVDETEWRHTRCLAFGTAAGRLQRTGRTTKAHQAAFTRQSESDTVDQSARRVEGLLTPPVRAGHADAAVEDVPVVRLVTAEGAIRVKSGRTIELLPASATTTDLTRFQS